jgi:hypothetical protein
LELSKGDVSAEGIWLVLVVGVLWEGRRPCATPRSNAFRADRPAADSLLCIEEELSPFEGCFFLSPENLRLSHDVFPPSWSESLDELELELPLELRERAMVLR